MNFAHTQQETVSKTFDYKYKGKGGKDVTESITITFRAEYLTPKFLDVCAHFQTNQDILGMAKQVASVLTDWSLFWQGPDDEVPQPFPPTFENLSERCSIGFLMDIVSQMGEPITGNGQTQPQSQNGLAVAAKSRTRKAKG